VQRKRLFQLAGAAGVSDKARIANTFESSPESGIDFNAKQPSLARQSREYRPCHAPGAGAQLDNRSGGLNVGDFHNAPLKEARAGHNRSHLLWMFQKLPEKSNPIAQLWTGSL